MRKGSVDSGVMVVVVVGVYHTLYDLEVTQLFEIIPATTGDNGT